RGVGGDRRFDPGRDYCAAARRLSRHLFRHADAGAVDDRLWHSQQDLFAGWLRWLEPACATLFWLSAVGIAKCQLRAISLYQSGDSDRGGAVPNSFRLSARTVVARR